MKGYVLSVAGVVLISAVISIIAPSGKMGKFVKSISRLFIFVVLISPFVRFAKEPETFFPSTEMREDDVFLRKYAMKLSEADEAEISAWMTEEYGVESFVLVSRSSDDFSYQKIVVRVTDFGINGEESHIDIMSAARERLLERYGCDVEVEEG